MKKGVVIFLDDFQRAQLREKILSYEYPRQVEILDYIMRDALLVSREGVLCYDTAQVFTVLSSAVVSVLKQNGIEFHAVIAGRNGSVCEWSSMAGTVCAAVADAVKAESKTIQLYVSLSHPTRCQLTADRPFLTHALLHMAQNTALLHDGRCLEMCGEQKGLSLLFPFHTGTATRNAPDKEELLKDSYSVVRILLHNCF